MPIHPIRLGVVFGLLLALIHAAWVGLIATGFAQPLIDFIFWIHFIAPPFQIQLFEWPRAVILIGVTFASGLMLGALAALVWNALHPRTR
jgi:hypothetical protein